MPADIWLYIKIMVTFQQLTEAQWLTSEKVY